MTEKLLGIIAINLTIITGLMVLQSIPTATAQMSPRAITPIAIWDPYTTQCLEIVGAPKKNARGVTGSLPVFNYE